jgi:predicted PurR-regulated permease PerM
LNRVMHDPPWTMLSSHALVWGGVVFVLTHHLVAAALAGFLVHALVALTASGLSPRFLQQSRARPVALALLVIGVLAGGAILGRWALHFSADIDLSRVLPQMAEVISRLRLDLPEFILVYLPSSPDTLKEAVANTLKAHGESLSSAGLEGLSGAVHLIWGVVIGAIISQATFSVPAAYRPLSAALLLRLERLSAAFRKVVFAQARISLVNTVLTASYLLLILPLAGIHLPLAKTLVALTFITGLLPVLGNLLSNTVIVVISLGVSLEVATASLVFLVLIHKLEYFLNARIIGHSVSASTWEMLLAMFTLESLFGLPGLVAAPVLYAYLKRELLAVALVGTAGPDSGDGAA